MTLHDRIENWRRYVLAHGSHYSQARSLEGDYCSPQHWHPEGPRGPEVWRADAELLEAAWTTVRPLESRSILLWHHIYRLPEWTIRRRVRSMYTHAIGKEQLPEEIERADSRFAVAIEAREMILRVSVHIAVDMPAETSV
jgi:hypothetical protein